MEKFKSYRKQIEDVKGFSAVDVHQNRDVNYKDALKLVKKYIQEKKLKNDEVGLEESNTKSYLVKKKEKYRVYIKEAYAQLKLRVDEYDNPMDFIEDALSDIVGYSILEDAFKDPEITDIFVNTHDEIFVEKNGENMPYWRKFRDEDHYLGIVERFMQDAGKELNSGAKKIVHAELYGDRICAISDKISTKQVSLTFRKHGYSEVTRQDLLNRNVMTEDMADLIGFMMQGELNSIVGGQTGSGKTTSMQALMNYYLSEKRILVAEDTQELVLENPNTLQLLSFKGKTEEETVSLGDLVETALRLKPRIIAVGEVRGGKEALAAVEAGETGHSTWYTMHGGTPVNILNRLITKYLMAMPSLGIEVVERIIGSSVDFICIQDAIPGVGRRMTVIAEVGYDFENRRVSIIPIYKFDFDTNSFIKTSNISDEKVEMMRRRGIKKEQLSRWIS